ncbi:MAG TPA: hypothetical protein VGG19_02020 [Tepidisphaeraceae bacterium]|jgi:hypothetical protein
MNEDAKLLDQFVEVFGILDNLLGHDIPATMQAEPSLVTSLPCWRPIKQNTAYQSLKHIYEVVPGPFPKLFEYFLLNYRWLEVDLVVCRLKANPTGLDLSDFQDEVAGDPCLCDYLLPRRLVPFAKGADANYDPVCFDLSRGLSNHDCPILQLSHEDIFVEKPTVETTVLADSFRDLVHIILDIANKRTRGA